MDFRWKKRRVSIFNSGGSAMVIVLGVVAALMLSGVFVLHASQQLSQAQAWSSSSHVAENVSDVIRTIVSDSSICLQGFDGAGSDPGLQFASGTFNPAQASQATGQDISLPGLYPSMTGTATQRFESGLIIPNSGLILQRVYIANSVPDGSTPNTYIADLLVQISAPNNSKLAVKPRLAARFRMQVTGGLITGCEVVRPVNSNQALCEAMQCVYSISNNGQGNCYCGVKPANCTNGTYIASIINHVPQCSTQVVSRSCASTPGSFLVALDQNSRPVCATAHYCPTGTSGSGLGGAATPSACRCNNSGETWTGSSCSVAPPLPPVTTNGACGNAVAGSYPDAAAATAAGLCSVGTSTVASLSGNGPWSWSCNGSNGGSSVPCAATMSPGANLKWQFHRCYLALGSGFGYSVPVGAPSHACLLIPDYQIVDHTLPSYTALPAPMVLPASCSTLGQIAFWFTTTSNVITGTLNQFVYHYRCQ